MFGFKVICWALLFIFKLRFPPGVSIATDLNALKMLRCSLYNEMSANKFYFLLFIVSGLFESHVRAYMALISLSLNWR
jgi:hypothetical protein